MRGISTSAVNTCLDSVLDPIIVELVASTVHRSEEYVTVKGREIPGMLYERTFDQQRINYLLDILAHVIRFGGQSFARITGSVPISRSFHSNLPERLVQGTFYCEVLALLLNQSAKMDMATRIVRTLRSSSPSSLGTFLSSNSVVLMKLN